MTKAELRSRILASRARMTPSDLLAAADALFAQLLLLLHRVPHEALTAYRPIGSEPGGPSLPERLAVAFPTSTLLLPVLRPDLDLDWSVYSGSMTRTERGLYEPTGPRLGVDAVTTAQVIIVPALAVDRDGHRLGRGGGSYDRALTRARPGATIVALLHDGELVERVPHEPHDRRITATVVPGLR
ncbi:5-formyltetrahydrofolate cyclo-ligase [Allorhizocola rhizosphaerae]|uniref:5-formyltetrahydrofolate cyclo-ligase n=1 Tax=Allorhizocola rhizosphaerae TaxID=1872709 RepID=UPI001FE8BD87|nr:5-formyltetrahydrofolate cyclo-ligase [Allorhizocola rhizosphaerae]